MEALILWFSRPENTKPLALVIFFVTFVGIVLYVYTGKKRGERLESYRDIPFLDEGNDGDARKNPPKDKQ